MSKTSKKAVSLLELLVVAGIISVLVLPTVDVLSSMVLSEADVMNDIRANQVKLAAADRIISEIRSGSYLYSEGDTITIPTDDGVTTVEVGDNAIAVLIPEFNNDGTINYSNVTTKTTFRGVAYSIISRNNWDGSGSNKYVLVETIYNNVSLTVDTIDNLELAEGAPIDWSSGDSNLLGVNFQPATLSTMGNQAFTIDSNKVTFGFVPKADATYFGSSLGDKNVNDKPYISSVVVENIH